MADTNAQMEELARILQDVNYEMNMFGKVTKQTADDMFDAKVKDKTGINNATKAIDKFGDAAGYVAGAAMSAGKAMLEGKKGAAAFNESIDSMAQAATAAAVALALMNPFGKVIGLVIAGVAAAVGGFAAYTKAANTMADQLYKTYSSLSKSGAAASDGMTGVKKASDQLGLSMEEMEDFVGQIAANSKDLALFSGSVYEGRQRLGDMGEALRGSRQDFLKLGMSTTDMSDGMLGYLKIQTRLGNSQTMTNAQLAEGAKKYLVEQDALTKLTGQTRKEMEDQRERALQGEQFAAKIRELQMQGPEGKKAAEELMKMNAIYEAAGPKMAAAFQASVTGNLSNADAQAANLASNGAMLETTQKVIAGQMSYTDAVTITGTAMGKTADSVGVVLGQFGAYNESFGPINEQLKLAQLAQGDITANMAKIKADQQKILEGGADKLLENQAKLITTQIDANKAMEAFIFKGIEPAQRAMEALAKATEKSANLMNELTPGGKKLEGTAKEVVSTVGGAGMGAGIGAVAGGLIGLLGGPVGVVLGAKLGAVIGTGIGGYLLKNTAGTLIDQAQDTAPPGRAAGGPVDAGKLYKVGESGEEFFRPKLAGDIIPNNKLAGMTSGNNMANLAAGMTSKGNMDNPAASDTIKSLVASLTVVSKSMTTGSQEMDDAFDEIVKDSAKLERLTDADTKRAEKYSMAYKSYIDLKTQLMDLETPDLKSQIDILQQKAAAAGEPAAGNAGGPPGGTGMKMPGAGNMPAMGGGQGVAGPSVPSGPEPHSSPVGSGGGGAGGKPQLTQVRSKTGKSTSVNAEYASQFQGVIDYLDSVGYNIYSLGGYVDRDVRGQPGKKSVHAHGGAIDINPAENPLGSQLVTDMPSEISQIAASLGLGWGGKWNSIKDAMHFSAARSEGGSLLKASDGGMFTGPTSGYNVELHGKEAVIPLTNGAIPINLEMPDVKKMFEGIMQSMKDAPEREVTAVASSDNRAMTELVNVMREQTEQLINAMSDMIREQKNSVSVQERILQTSM